ncbi:FtsK/SpoIIIE domain-containing protein [Streptosporangium sp. NPDC051022]|uniref:FtsK/SpoIIIE domain-containing protein n=1 Tax=Streptosporangium sp. NPDC051022 TaxID=3155752 RepID=UPI00342136EC
MVLRRMPGAEVQHVVATRPDTSVVFSPTVVKTPAVVTLVVWLWRVLAGLVRMVWRHPVACTLVVVSGAGCYLAGWRVALIGWGLTAGVVSSWAGLWPAAAVRLLVWPALAWWRLVWVYRRRWRAVMAVTGLGVTLGGRGYAPDLVKVRCDRHTDRITVKMLAGQADQQYAEAQAGLSHGFGAPSCRVSSSRPGWVTLTFPRRDALARTVAARPYPDAPVVTTVDVGMGEDGRPYRLQVHGTHVLIAGATGAGKGSWLWSVVRGLLPARAVGLVKLWGLDPKRMELSFGRALFDEYAATAEGCADLLEAAVTEMHKRADRYAGVQRSHIPSVEDPFILVMVDEIAFLTAYQTDKGLKVRIMAALATLATQGRAVGIGVMAALQDPRKDVLSIRNLFPDKIALRLDEAEQVDMVLGDGARDRGALADHIARDPKDPSVGAGVAYVRRENDPTPIRVRAAYVSDGDIRHMVLKYSTVSEAL